MNIHPSVKNVIVFLLCAIICTSAFAQKVTESPAVISKETHLYGGTYGARLISNEPDRFYMYLFPKFNGWNALKHRIAIYDKTSRTISYKSLNLEDDQDFISTFGTGDYFFADYLNNSRKTGCTYGTARLAKDKGGALEPTPVFSLKKGWMKGISLTSPDGKMHATVLKADIRKESSRFYVYVYDMDGTEVYHKAVIPSISGNHMQFEGAFLSNTGEVAILVTSFQVDSKGPVCFQSIFSAVGWVQSMKARNTSLHLAIVNDEEIIQKQIPHFSFGDIHSADIVGLKNGNYFIGGYYGPDPFTPTTGYFSCLFDRKSEELEGTYHYRLPAEQLTRTDGCSQFFTLANKIYELDNGQIVMLGENCAICIRNVMNSTIYRCLAGDIVYQTFDQTGEGGESQVIRKLQGFARYQSLQRRTSEYFAFDYNFKDFCLSFSSFQKGNDIYLLYNNSLSPDDMFYLNNNMGYVDFDKCREICVRLAKISPNSEVERETVMKCDTHKNFLLNLWLMDDEDVYFSTLAHKSYIIESFSTATARND